MGTKQLSLQTLSKVYRWQWVFVIVFYKVLLLQFYVLSIRDRKIFFLTLLCFNVFHAAFIILNMNNVIKTNWN